MTWSRALAGVAAGMAVSWMVRPGKADATIGLRALTIRHNYFGTWASLAVVGALVALNAPSWSRTTAGAVSPLSYGLFLGALLLWAGASQATWRSSEFCRWQRF